MNTVVRVMTADGTRTLRIGAVCGLRAGEVKVYGPTRNGGAQWFPIGRIQPLKSVKS
jgi:hypothetical protein